MIAGLLVGLGLTVAAVEVFQPLSGRVEEGPAPDPAGENVISDQWAMQHHGEPGRWREMISPEGKATVLPGRPVRIVAQILAADEVLVEIADPGRVIAHSALSADERYSNIASVATGWDRFVSNNAEAILRLKPDLVFVASFSTLETVSQLRDAGVPLVRLSQFDSIGAIERNIRLIGFAVGEDERAQGLIRVLRAGLEGAAARVSSSPRVVSWADGRVPAAGTIFDDLCDRLGLVNVASRAGMNGWPDTSTEQIARWDPDWIVLTAPAGEEERVRRELLSRPAVAATRAAREGAIIVVPGPIYISVTHHVVRFAEALVDAIERPTQR